MKKFSQMKELNNFFPLQFFFGSYLGWMHGTNETRSFLCAYSSQLKHVSTSATAIMIFCCYFKPMAARSQGYCTHTSKRASIKQSMCNNFCTIGLVQIALHAVFACCCPHLGQVSARTTQNLGDATGYPANDLLSGDTLQLSMILFETLVQTGLHG